MENAMELRTRKASGVLRRLVREWTIDFDTTSRIGRKRTVGW